MEILAPAGNEQSLIAAVRSGADAVYLGTGAFNARRNADNFKDNSLAEAVNYCHGRGVKVYVTLNTLIRDEELPAFLDAAREVAEAGPDGVIVQDLAVVKVLKTICPDLPLVASTQMSVHNAAGVKALEDLGFSRVVLARELTLEEIRKIRSETRAELEVFIHGALCMSVSGMCYYSAMMGERSGNRGLCAQPCRLNSACNGRPYALSLKDMSFITRVRDLEAAGVCSVKIEGRMKRPEYVAAAVTAVRTALDGKEPDMATLQAVFSRSGFTDGYLTGKRNVSPHRGGRRGLQDRLREARRPLPPGVPRRVRGYDPGGDERRTFPDGAGWGRQYGLCLCSPGEGRNGSSHRGHRPAEPQQDGRHPLRREDLHGGLAGKFARARVRGERP